MKKDKKKNSEEMIQIDEDVENEVSNIETELRQPLWSVVSFEQCVAKNLTYVEAEQKIAELERQNVSGLCLVTDAVAERIDKRE
jgi:hypothetical protein